MTRQPYLTDIDDRECWDLMASRPVGRLVWQGPAGLTAVPVNFRTGDGEIVVRTTAYSAVARECDDSPVAFQVDHVDPLTRSGWSVLVRGTAHVGTISAQTEEVDVWPGGPRPLVVRVEAVEVTGRRLPAG